MEAQLGAVVFYEKRLAECQGEDNRHKLSLQVFSIGSTIHCEMELSGGKTYCALLSLSEAHELAAAIAAAASFSGRIR
jgi:hypothetical protein